MKVAKKNILVNSMALLILFLFCNCVSIFTIHQNIRDDFKSRPIVYSGTRCTLTTVPGMFLESGGMGSPSSIGRLEKLVALFLILDLPFSFLLDTIIAPITIPIGIYKSFNQSRTELKCQ